jgi:hypothetical protein
MPIVQTGVAFEPHGGGPIWDILDNGNVICQFSHLTFSHILNGASVKFIDDDSNPGMAEQVWSASQVAPLVESALPANGATPLAYEQLEIYVMSKLLADLLNQRSGGPTMANQLPNRLAQIQRTLDDMTEQRATARTLHRLGI